MTPVQTDTRDIVLGSIKELPPLPLVLHELLAVMREANCSTDQITRVLSTDQALASKILRLVNSSFYGMSGNVTTISQAVIILGHSALRSLATGLAVAEGLGHSLPQERRLAFWQHALATAAGAEILARRTGMGEPEEAFVAGLLHDIGHLILMMALPTEHSVASGTGALGDLEQERRLIGLDHCRAGRYLLHHWKLPQPLLECVRLHHATATCQGRENPLLTTVALADRLSRLHNDSGETPTVAEDAVQLMTAMNLTPDTVTEMLPDIALRLAGARAFLQVAEIAPGAIDTVTDRRGLHVVVLADDRRRLQWLECLAEYFGHTVKNAHDYLADSERCPIHAVIYDAKSISDEQAARLAPILYAAAADLLIPGDGDFDKVPAMLRHSCRKLPLVYGAGELAP